jgi:hypothetical protein
LEEFRVRRFIIAVASAGALFASVGFASADTTAATTPAATATTTTSATTAPANAPATTSAAAPAATATATTPTKTANAGDEIVCRSLPPPTGTRFGGRHICKPARVWQDEQERAQHDLAKEQRETIMNGN